MDNVPLIYNIPTDQWVHDFVVAGPLPTTATPTSAPTGTSSPSLTPTVTSKSSSLGGAIGGAIGGVIVVVVLIGFYIYRRRKNATKLLPSFKADSGGNNDALDDEQKTRDQILLQKAASATNMDFRDPEKDWSAIYPADSRPHKEDVSTSTPPSLPPPRRPRSSPRPALYTQRSSLRDGKQLPEPPGEWDSLGPDHLSKSTLTPDPDGISYEHLRPTALTSESDSPGLARIRKKRARSRDPNTASSGVSSTGASSGPDPHRPLSDITDTESPSTGAPSSDLGPHRPLSGESPFTGVPSYDPGPHRPLSAISDIESPSMLTPAFITPPGTSGSMNPQEGTPNIQVRTPLPSNPQTYRPRAPQEYPDLAWDGMIQNNPQNFVLPAHEPQYGAWGSEATSDPNDESIRAPQLVPRTLEYRAPFDPSPRLSDNPHKMASPDGGNSSAVAGSGEASTYFPTPPSDKNTTMLMEKRLALMKAQHDLDLEQMRLGQEAQRKAVARQAREARKARQSKKEERPEYI